MNKLFRNRQEKGITLIALVITIIVLVILAGVSISMLMGPNGIISQAQYAKRKNIEAEVDETVNLAYTSVNTEYMAKIARGEIAASQVKGEDLKTSFNTALGVTGTDSNYKVSVSTEDVAGEEGVIGITVAINGKLLSQYKQVTNNSKAKYEISLTYDSTTGKSKLEHIVVAMIGQTYYNTLQEAFDAVPANNEQTTVVLLHNYCEATSTKENQNIILDLNKKTLSNNEDKAIIDVKGNLNIINGTMKGKYTTKVPVVKVEEGATLTIDDAELLRNSEKDYEWETVELYGDLNVNSGVIKNDVSNAICTYSGYNSNINIQGGEIASESSSIACITNNGEMIMEGGTVSSEKNVAISNRSGGTATISGGEVSSVSSTAINNRSGGTVTIREMAKITNGSTSYVCIGNYGEMIMEGGTVSSEKNIAIWNPSGGTATISGGEASSVSSYAIYNDNGGTVTINGGNINAGKTSINNYGGMTISGTANVSNNVSGYYIIYNQSSAQLNILGGKIVSLGSGIYNYSGATLVVGSENSNSKTIPEIIAKSESAIYTPSNSFTFYSGIIKSATRSTVINATISNAKPGYSATALDNRSGSGYYEVYWH